MFKSAFAWSLVVLSAAPAAFASDPASTLDPTVLAQLRELPRARTGMVCVIGENVGVARDRFNGVLQLPHQIRSSWIGRGNRWEYRNAALWPPYDVSNVTVTHDGKFWVCGVLTSKTLTAVPPTSAPPAAPVR